MSSKLSIDKPLIENTGRQLQWALSRVDCIGVELEIEGGVFLDDSPGKYWLAKEDHSLRQGIEYVLAKPYHISKLPDLLSDLKAQLARCTNIEPSIRCSTHVHVSVSDFTVRQVYNAVTAYYLFEEVLVETQPTDRNGNLFCLKMSNADGIREGILTSLSNGGFWRHFNSPGHWKYGALNLATPYRYGSLEFRFLGAITDTVVLGKWVTLLHNLVTNTKNISPRTLLRMYEDLDTFEFIDTILGPGTCDFLGIRAWGKTKVNSLMHTNYDFVNLMNRYLVSPKFRMPSVYWNDDLAPVENAPFPNPTAGLEIWSALYESTNSPQPSNAVEDDF